LSHFNGGMQSGSILPKDDNTFDLGNASLRWDDVYATNGTINTSDARKKTEVKQLSDVKKAVAKEFLAKLGGFQFLEAVAEKGEDGAREHYGMTVQDAIKIMEKHGLDPFKYAFICYDKWDEEKDADGNIIKEAGDSYGFRYTELIMFIMAGVLT